MSSGINAWPSPKSITPEFWVRMAWVFWRPAIAQAAGQANRFFSQLTSVNPAVTLSQQGAAADITFPTDVAAQLQYTEYGVNASTSLACLVTGAPFASPYPLLPTGSVQGTYDQVIVSRKIMRFNGVFTGTNGGVYGFLFGGTNSGAVYSYADPVNTNKWMGVAYSAAGLQWGYRDGAVTTVFPLTNDPNAYATYEHRLYKATATQAARYELRINGALIGVVSFASANTPRYALSQGLVPGFLFGGLGLPATRAALRFTEWEIGIGPDTPNLLLP